MKQIQIPISKRVENINYQFYLSFFSKNYYEGMTEISFDLKSKDSPLSLNFNAKQISRCIINQKQQQKIKVKNQLITLPLDELVLGRNSVIVFYKKQYDCQGHGLTYLIDADQKHYIFSHFEPEGCRNVFPCFDCPSIKATMEMRILTPDHWIARSNQVIKYQGASSSDEYLKQSESNQVSSEMVKSFVGDKKGKIWVFNKTQILPTYCFSLIAGQYYEIQYQDSYKNIPMSIYGINSYKHQIQKYSELIFKTNSQSIRFYQQTLGIPYSFSKCDSVFVFQFYTGAMQNAGLIIYSSSWFDETELTPRSVLCLCAVIAHQISHQWFGNLVTLQSWNETWLNEGFANYISYVCVNKIKHKLNLEFDIQAMNGLLCKKTQSCRHDNSKYTHPVRASQIQNPINMFDTIVYTKGAYIVKQLVSIFGDQFWLSISQYLLEYLWKCVTIEDLFRILEKNNKIENLNLSRWKSQWLYGQSFNIIKTQWKQNTIEISQHIQNQKHGVNHYYKFKVALFKQDMTYDSYDITLENEPSICIPFSQEHKAILVDYNDDNFIQRKLDTKSKQFFVSNLIDLPQTLMKSLVWKCFYESVVNGQMYSEDYLQVFYPNMETLNPELLQFILFDTTWIINGYTPPQKRFTLRDQLRQYIHHYMIGQKDNINNFTKLVLKKYSISFSNTRSGRLILQRWSNNNEQGLLSYQLSLSEQWRIVNILHCNGQLTKQKFLKKTNQLFNQEKSYRYKLKLTMWKGKFLEKQQAELVLWAITHPNSINSNYRQALIGSYTYSSLYESSKSYDILIEAAKHLSNKRWIQLFDNIWSPSSDKQQAILDYQQLIQKLGHRQCLKIAIQEQMMKTEESMKTFAIYNQNN